MKKLLLITMGTFLSMVAWGQNAQQNITVRGMVIDSANNQSLSYVTAALQDVNTKLPVKSALTKED
ncbi:MAG: TonB-dependent receptor, partial [Mucilaginibacter sp.]|nr:TonB-dependent receptor [Mucilaginibacter sp.]